MANTYVDLASSLAASDRAVGGDTLAVTEGDGALFGAPTADSPLRLICYRGDDFLTILKVTGVSGDTLTIDGALGHADAAIQVGDYIENGLAAGDLEDLWTAIADVETTPGPQGDPGSDGAPGSVWREGSGAPSDTLGVDGDFYLDGAAGDVYLRSAGAYSVVANIQGATGPKGDTGDQGPQGLQGPKGDQGDPGPAGADGATGPAGTPGSLWREGSGTPSNSLGVDSDLYLDTATGDVYVKASGVYSVAANIKGPAGSDGAGSVTSVGLSAPSTLLVVSGSPVTSSGTLTMTLASQGANVVFAGPSSGIGGTPTFRTLVAADVPTLAQSKITNLVTDLAAKAADSTVVHKSGDETIDGVKTFSSTISGSVTGTASGLSATLPVAKGGTGLTALGTANQVLAVNAAGTALEYHDAASGGGADLHSLTISDDGSTVTMSTAETKLVLEQTGDTYGSTSLSLTNRAGANGATFATNNSGADLVDFAFKTYSKNVTLRVEGRDGYALLGTAPEWQFGSFGTSPIVAGPDKVAVQHSLGVFGPDDAVAAPQATLDVQGSVRLKLTPITTSPSGFPFRSCIIQIQGPAGSARTVNITPFAAPGTMYVFVDEVGDAATNNITLVPPGGGTINGAASYVIDTDYGFAWLYHAGSNNYFIISKG